MIINFRSLPFPYFESQRNELLRYKEMALEKELKMAEHRRETNEKLRDYVRNRLKELENKKLATTTMVASNSPPLMMISPSLANKASRRQSKKPQLAARWPIPQSSNEPNKPSSPTTTSHPVYTSPISQPVYSKSPMSQPVHSVSPMSQPVHSVSPMSQPVYSVSPTSQPVHSKSPTSQLVHSVLPTSQPVYSVSPMSQPVYSVSPMSQPVHSVLPTSQPVHSVSPMSQPVHSVSPMSQPVHSVLPTSQPVHSVLPTSQPVHSVSPMSQPVHSVSPMSQPVHSKSPTSQPVHSKSPTSQPVHSVSPTSQPVHSKSPTSQPVHSKSPTSQPVHSKSPTSQPVHSKSPTSQPVHSKSPTSQPVHSKSPMSQPVYSVSPTSQPVHSVLPTSQPVFQPKTTVQFPPTHGIPLESLQTQSGKRKLRDVQDPVWILTAMAKGYLTRRLIKTDKIQNLIKTVKDAENVLKTLDNPTTVQDFELQQRVISQLQTAKLTIHEIFFLIPASKRMAYISQSRSIQKIKQFKDFNNKSGNKEYRLSSATVKSLERRKRHPMLHQDQHGKSKLSTQPSKRVTFVSSQAVKKASAVTSKKKQILDGEHVCSKGREEKKGKVMTSRIPVLVSKAEAIKKKGKVL